jgi:hypothetical protein
MSEKKTNKRPAKSAGIRRVVMDSKRFYTPGIEHRLEFEEAFQDVVVIPQRGGVPIAYRYVQGENVVYVKFSAKTYLRAAWLYE